MTQNCLICNRISLWRKGQNPYFIHEFENSIFVVGDHQFYAGYSLLLLKNHVRELHEVELSVQIDLFQELMSAGKALVAAFEPWKMNYSCYGNEVQHIHWHLFPRPASESNREKNPWHHSSKFNQHLINSQKAQDLAKKIRANLEI